jgi:hypothetical protein
MQSKKMIFLIIFCLWPFSMLLAETSMYLLPFVGRTAGVGVYYGPVIAVQNIADTSTGIASGKVLGRVDGEGAVLTGFPIISDMLTFGYGVARLNQLYFDTSYTRGMEKDQKVTQTTSGKGSTMFLNWYFFDKHLQISNISAKWDVTFDKYFNENEEEIELPDIHLEDLKTTFLINNLVVDFTDNIDNPTSGANFGLSYNIARTNTDYSGTDTLSYYANGFIPIGSDSTWVFRGFRSTATVKQQGSTDEDTIRTKLNIDCDQLTNQNDKKECTDLKDAIVSYLSRHNEYGTATPLGGNSMQRSYREARFRGKHSAFVGTELRLNIPEIFSNYQLQVAFIAESGSVNDSAENLGDEIVSSYGAALRLMVEKQTIRLEAAVGDESQEWHLTIGQPW